MLRRPPTSVVAIAGLLALTACSGDAPPASPRSPSPSVATHTSTPQARATATGEPARTRSAPTPSARSDRSARTAEVSQARQFTDADALADALVASERAIRDPDVAVDDLEPAAWAQQQAYRDLVQHPEWHDRVRARVPGELRTAFDRNLRATAQLRELTEPRDALPDWRIVAPPPPAELRGHYEAAAAEFGVGWEYLAGIHLVESRMGRIRGTSTAGAQGPMQFLPSTWEAYGQGDIQDPRDAIRAAARYLVAHGAPQDMDGALYAYNHSDRYVTAISEHAAVMREDPAAYRGYYHWRVYYRMTDGDRILHEGYGD